jgi:hypothetical protein
MKFALLNPSAALTGELKKSSNWRRKKAGQWTRPDPPKATLPKSGSLASLRITNRCNCTPRASWEAKQIAIVSGGIYRLNLSSRSTKEQSVRESWFQAGWGSLYFDGSYLESLKFPLGKAIFSVPGAESLSLQFKPVRWLPNIKFELEEFIGEIPSLPDFNYEDAEDYFSEQEDYGNVTDAGYV